MQMQQVKRVRSALPAGVAALLGSAILAPGMARAVEFEYSGYIREHLSVNLQDNDQFEPKGSPGGNPVTFMGDEFGGQGEFSMIRHSGKLEASADFGPFQIAGVGRIARETRTSYERGLQDASKAIPAYVTTRSLRWRTALAFGAFGVTTNANGGPLMPGDAVYANAGLFGYGGGTTDDLLLDDYDSTELRELYVTFDLGERTHFKLGKQQVVWGETDFFRAMDIIHGYDLRWRSFLELENEELRKPLNLANVTIDVPELAGALQLIYRPGWDGADDVGDDGPINGGRWAPAPWTGAGVTSSLIGPINRHHKYGDEDDANYGFRWSGTFKQVGYSFAYYRGISSEGVTTYNPILSPGGSNWLWDPKDNGIGPNQRLVELLSPKVETYGFTFNAYSGCVGFGAARRVGLHAQQALQHRYQYLHRPAGRFPGAGGVAAGREHPLGAGCSMPPLKGILNDPNDPGSAYSTGRPGHGRRHPGRSGHGRARPGSGDREGHPQDHARHGQEPELDHEQAGHVAAGVLDHAAVRHLGVELRSGRRHRRELRVRRLAA